MSTKKGPSFALHNAVKQGDVQTVLNLLKKGDSILKVDSDKNTPLHLAYLLKHDEITDYFLAKMKLINSYEQNPKNKYGITHLHIACTRGNAECVMNFELAGAIFENIISHDSPINAGYSCLQLACESKSLETIAVIVKCTQLLYSCLHVKTTQLSHLMSLQGIFEHCVIEMHHDIDYLSDKKQILMSDLQRACFHGQVSEVEILLEKGMEVDEVMSGNAKACPLYNPLHFAIEAHQNRQETVEMLLAYGVDVSWKNGFCMTPLQLAMYRDNHRESKCLFGRDRTVDDTLSILYKVTKDKDTNSMDAFGLTYFHIAVACNDMEMVTKFIDKGEGDCKPILPNLKNFSMYTPLHFAVKYGNMDIAKLLIEQGANVNANEDKYYFTTPLQVAINYGQHKMIDLLLANGANTKVLTFDTGRTTMHLLVERYGDYEDEKPTLLGFVKKLFKHGVNIDAKDSRGDTVLHNACWNLNSKFEIVDELLDCGADINLINEEGETAFHVACSSICHPDYKTYFKLYLHVEKLRDFGLEVCEKNKKICKTILEMKEEWRESEDWQAIEKMTSDEELTRLLDKRLIEIRKLKADMLDENVSLYNYIKMDISEASKYTQNEKLKEIITDKKFKDMYESYGYMISVKYKQSLSWLKKQEIKKKNTENRFTHTSAEKISTEIQNNASPLNKISKVIEQQMPPNSTLHSVIKLGNIEWVKELLKKGASMKIIDLHKSSPLHLAFSLNHIDIVDLLLSHMNDTSYTVNQKNNIGLTHLHIAASRGNTTFVQKLIDSGANPSDFVNYNSLIFEGYSVLQFACDSKSLETLKIISKAIGLFCSLCEENINMLFDVTENFSQYVKFTISYYHNKHEKNNVISNFHMACFTGSLNDIKGFLHKGTNINAPMNRASCFSPLYTALHFAIESDTQQRQKVELLLKYRADINRKNGFGMTALHLAMYNEDSIEDGLVKILYELVEDKEVNPMDAYGLTYFHIAVAQNDMLLVKKMLLNREDVNQALLPNCRNFSMYTPLHFAIKYGHKEMVKLLIEQGAKVNANEDDLRFETPLQLAIRCGKIQIIEILLSHHANAKVIRISDKATILHLLTERYSNVDSDDLAGLDERLELAWLIEKLAILGVDLDAKNSDGFTALHLACLALNRYSDLIDWLLIAGADINVKDNKGKDTPLAMASRSDSLDEHVDDILKVYYYVQTLKDLGLKIDPKNEKFCELVMEKKSDWIKYEEGDDDDEYWIENLYSEEMMIKKKEERWNEIEMLKKDMLTDDVSMYNYLKMSPDKAAAFTTNERIQKIIDDDLSRNLYEVYGYLIPVVYRKSLRWIENQETVKKKPDKKTHRGKRRRA